MSKPVRIATLSNVVEIWTLTLQETDGRFSIVAESQFATRVTLGSNLDAGDIRELSESLLDAVEKLVPKPKKKPRESAWPKPGDPMGDPCGKCRHLRVQHGAKGLGGCFCSCKAFVSGEGK